MNQENKKYSDSDSDYTETSKTRGEDKVHKDTNDGWDDFDCDWELNDAEEKSSGVSSSLSLNNKNTYTKTECNSNENEYKPQPHNIGNEVQKPSWIWKPWGGVISLLSTATEGVNTLSSQVSQSISTIMENNSGISNPNEELKAQTSELNKKSDLENDKRSSTGFENIVTGVTSIGNKVITGGLDTLEEIGRKTMNILQENDPLLLNKRKLLGLESEKPNLSQVLREAKEKSEEIEKNLKQMQKQSYKKQLHFETLFDFYYGLVHLEALEMLSKQSKLKLQSLLNPLTGNARTEMEETLNEVEELCELGDIENDENDGMYNGEELKTKLLKATEDLDVQVDFNDIIKCWNDKIEWLSSTDSNDVNAAEVYENGLRCLAETCALEISKLHKIAEMLLIKDIHSTANEADALVQLTNVFCFHLNGIANRFGRKLNSFKQNESDSLITSLFVEVYNSTSYIQSSFQLFIPILQIGAA